MAEDTRMAEGTGMVEATGMAKDTSEMVESSGMSCGMAEATEMIEVIVIGRAC
jgi:hypothetical protein